MLKQNTSKSKQDYISNIKPYQDMLYLGVVFVGMGLLLLLISGDNMYECVQTEGIGKLRYLKLKLLLYVLAAVFVSNTGCSSLKQNPVEKERFSATLIILNNGILEFTDGSGKTLRTVKSTEPMHDFLWVDSSAVMFTAKKDGNFLLCCKS